MIQERKWKIIDKTSDNFVSQFSEYPKLVLQLLSQRGLTKKEQLNEFFNATYATDVHDPYLLKDMKKAVDRILAAIHNGEKIFVYGDYDADGVCGAVVVCSALRSLGVNAGIYIPSRINEGYSLNEKALTGIISKGARLIITVDCGATNHKEIAFAQKQGADVIVVDHHLVPTPAPPAYAMLNPNKEGEVYPCKILCAAGVAFKLTTALLQSDFARKHGIKEECEKWLLDMVAIASVADMVPLLGENRTLVKYGLIVIEKTQRIGLKALLHLQPRRMWGAGFEDTGSKITSRTIAFMIAPRINATSRMKHALMSFELLNTKDDRIAEQLAKEIDEVNSQRRKDVETMLGEARSMIEKDIKERGTLPSVIFIGKDEWSTGLVGLVSMRLTEQYARPSFVYGKSNGHTKGSCRGIGSFHVVKAMGYCQKKHKDLFIDFGGHAGAGGFAIECEKLEIFKHAMLEFGNTQLELGALEPFLSIDAEVVAQDINWELFDWLLKFEPYGEGNKKPLFIMKNMTVVSARGVGKTESHLKLNIKAESGATGQLKFFDCIGFGLCKDKIQYCSVGAHVDVVFELEANEWNNNRALQFKLKDVGSSK